MGHKRSQRVAKCHTSLIKIEGVEKTEEAKFYFGKRVAYVYKATKEVRGSKIRVIWGRITRSHGNSGVVRAKFAHNIPPQAFAARVRIMLYPRASNRLSSSPHHTTPHTTHQKAMILCAWTDRDVHAAQGPVLIVDVRRDE